MMLTTVQLVSMMMMVMIFFDECHDVVDYANDLGDGEYDDANDSNQGTDDNYDDSGECGIDDYSGKCERLTDDKVDDGASGFDSRIIIIARWFIVIFFRIQHQFKISNKAANAILALFSTILNLISHPLKFFIPNSFKMAMTETEIDSIIEKELYVVCPKESCNAIYDITTCNKGSTCSSTSYGKVCGHVLGYEKHLSFEMTKWNPFKLFNFIRPSTWIKEMFHSVEFKSLIENNDFDSGGSEYNIIGDVYNGRVWKKFSDQGYFSDKHNLGLMLNVDWFKPFERSEYKVAAIMLSILNLPRTERLKKKWTIIAGKVNFGQSWGRVGGGGGGHKETHTMVDWWG